VYRSGGEVFSGFGGARSAAITVKDSRVYDWNFLEDFHESLKCLFQAEAVSNVGDQHSYLDLVQLRQRMNPDVSCVVQDLDMILQFTAFKSASYSKNRLSKNDTEALMQRYKE